MNDPMAPSASPNRLQTKWGVRRANDLPLYLLGVAAAIFLIVIGLVAMDRAKTKHREETAKTAAGSNAAMFANEIAGEHKGGMIPAVEPVIHDNSYSENPNLPSVPPMPASLPSARHPATAETQEMQRIRQLKVQQFEEALKAKTGVQIARRASQDAPRTQAVPVSNTDPTVVYKERLASLKGAGLIAHEDYEDAGQTQQERSPRNDIGAFDNREGNDRWKLDSRPTPPRSPFTVLTTSVIPATLITGINSSLPGKIFGQVSQDVFDTATGKYLLIPQGTKLEGEYSSEVAYGQASVLVAWQRLVFPDGKTMDIGAMPGSTGAGYAGFTDQVNNHYARLFGTAILMSAISAGVALSQSRNQIGGTFGAPTTSSVLSATLGQQLGRVITQMISKNLNISPTLEIRPGYRFNVTVTKDMVLARPYQAFDYRGGRLNENTPNGNTNG
ncbi:type IV secretion system protein VirB10 [Nitrosospira multiformis]|uniref:Type IV secretion system protein VirB10 n=1 Tax=Nitrosospira multiformis TaxID=1231 RepID=A0A2T5I6H2_9PROT|nr:TrbI/VirB10 family protein [Nitrosospira multiformis]PTQ79434.1 type IV secretion system protein VirB10 [Nitrosospira multiformis]